jgi:hypothetical protein
VVSGPGLALFDTPSGHNPLLRVSEDGAYRVRLTATDGELTSTAELTVSIDDLGAGAVNLARGPLRPAPTRRCQRR